jgi:4-amino-4-deoxy-L-arabinose transferase-like glycosyltransferase
MDIGTVAGPVAKPSGRGYRFGLLGLLALGLLIGLAFQGSRGLYETTEGRYALCAKEMLLSGHWLEPTVLGLPHWSKPPLTYWGIAAGLKLFGMNAWGARFFIAIAFAVTVVLVTQIGKLIWNGKAGLYSGVVYATSALPVAVAFSVNTDTFLTLFETAVVLCYWAALRAGQHSKRRWILGMWLALALGFATKGPPALLILLPVAAWQLLSRTGEPRAAKRVFLQPAGWLIFLLVGGGWYIVEIIRHPQLLSYFLGDEVAARVATDKFGRNPEWYKPFTVYLPVLLFGGGIWSWCLFRLMVIKRAWHRSFWKKLFTRRDRPAFFLVIWIIAPLIVFSLSQSRLPNYVLPLYPAIALLIGHYLMRLVDCDPQWRRPVGAAAVAAALLCVAGKAVASYVAAPARDMGALAKRCKPVDLPATSRFVLYMRDDERGLDFYLDSPVVRVFNEARPEVPAKSFDDVCEEAVKAPGDHQFCFIAKRKNGEARTMIARLNKQGLDTRIIGATRSWLVVQAVGHSQER